MSDDMKGPRSDFPGRDGGTGKNKSKSSPHGQIKTEDGPLTSMVRGKHDHHPFKGGKTNHA